MRRMRDYDLERVAWAIQGCWKRAADLSQGRPILTLRCVRCPTGMEPEGDELRLSLEDIGVFYDEALQSGQLSGRSNPGIVRLSAFGSRNLCLKLNFDDARFVNLSRVWVACLIAWRLAAASNKMLAAGHEHTPAQVKLVKKAKVRAKLEESLTMNGAMRGCSVCKLSKIMQVEGQLTGQDKRLALQWMRRCVTDSFLF